MAKSIGAATPDSKSVADESAQLEPKLLNEPFLLETPVEDVSETSETNPSAIAKEHKKQRSVFFPLILGGALAFAGGYGLAKYQPNGWPLQDTTGLEAKLADQAKAIAGLETKLAAATIPSDMGARLSALEAGKSAEAATVLDSVSQLADRVGKLESQAQTSGSDPAAIKVLQDQIDALSNGSGVSPQVVADAEARMKAAEARTAELQAESEAAANKAKQTAALAQISSALESGLPYDQALQGLGDVPQDLSASAANGVPALAILQAEFPDAARAALDASLRADMGSSWSERVGAFLKTQTGARSLTPREGTDPDAILSRAEAALGKNDIAAALSELDALPDAAKAPMQEWRAKATQRLAATTALAAMKTALGE